MEQNPVSGSREGLNGAGDTAVDPVLIADVVPLESGKAIALGLPVYDALVVFVPGQEIAVERVLGALDHSGGNGRTGGKVHVRHHMGMESNPSLGAAGSLPHTLWPMPSTAMESMPRRSMMDVKSYFKVVCLLS